MSHDKAARDGRSAAHVVVGSDDGVLYGRPTDSTRPGSKSIAANISGRPLSHVPSERSFRKV